MSLQVIKALTCRFQVNILGATCNTDTASDMPWVDCDIVVKYENTLCNAWGGGGGMQVFLFKVHGLIIYSWILYMNLGCEIQNCTSFSYDTWWNNIVFHKSYIECTVNYQNI